VGVGAWGFVIVGTGSEVWGRRGVRLSFPKYRGRNGIGEIGLFVG